MPPLNAGSVQVDQTAAGDGFGFPKMGDKVGLRYQGFIQETGVEFESSAALGGDGENKPVDVVVGAPEVFCFTYTTTPLFSFTDSIYLSISLMATRLLSPRSYY